MNTLNALQGDDIQAKGFSISTAEALRSFLRELSEVISLRSAITTGEITPTDIKKYVNELLRSFCAGKKFANEISLAAIAVAMETLPGPFAEEYIKDLARLRIQEIPLASRVARLSLSQRREVMIGLTDRSRIFAPLEIQNTEPREHVPVWIDAEHADDKFILRGSF